MPMIAKEGVMRSSSIETVNLIKRKKTKKKTGKKETRARVQCRR
jgi:hypothetical protein